MGLEIDDKVDLSNARSVRLAGRDFHVAPLPLRGIVELADHLPKLAGISANSVDAVRVATLAEVTFIGLRRAYPKLTRDEFLDMPIKLDELIAAVPIVIEQAGGKVGDSAGEQKAASDSTKSIGTSSSPA